jgi:hypothetical protein
MSHQCVARSTRHPTPQQGTIELPPKGRAAQHPEPDRTPVFRSILSAGVRGPGQKRGGKMSNVKILDSSTPEDDYTPQPDDYEMPYGDGEGAGPEDNLHAPSSGPDFNAIFGAPDLTLLIGGAKRSRTATARRYEQQSNSLLKALTIGALNTGNFADAATYLWHGPAFSTAIGVLAEQDTRARKALDMLTAPANPWAMFFITAIPMISQIARNHETAVKGIPKTWKNRKQRRAEKAATEPPPRFTLHLPFGRTIKLRFSMHLNAAKMLAGFRSQTHDPNDLAATVFGDSRVQDALRKIGVNIQNAR